MTNHVIDPSFFYDCIEEFAFDYKIHCIMDVSIDDAGMELRQYETFPIRGSLQPQRAGISKSFDGNIKSQNFDFYCKSLYRIKVGDVIAYNGAFLLVNDVQPYDEYGVRQCTLSMQEVAPYNDLSEYLLYLQGDKIV